MLLLQEGGVGAGGGGELSKQGDKWLVGQQALEGTGETGWWKWNVGDSSGGSRRRDIGLKQAGDCSWSANTHLKSCEGCYQQGGEGSVGDRAMISGENKLTADWPRL